MNDTLFSLTDEQAAERDAFVERILQSTAGAFDTFTLFIGQKLDFYRLLAEHGAMTSLELAVLSGMQERYVREWLEQQTVVGILAVENHEAPPAQRCFRLPMPHAEVLVDVDSLWDRLLAGSPLKRPLQIGKLLDSKGNNQMRRIEAEAPAFHGIHLTFCQEIRNPLLALKGRASAGGQAIDLRLQSHRWLNEFEKRGGRIFVEKVTVPRLDENGWLVGRFPPTVRLPVGTLPAARQEDRPCFPDRQRRPSHPTRDRCQRGCRW